jgi:DNA-binding MarR family transcriptional regulator/N-acetylglutamate synthase-like GNAT family acetyltransferase
MDLNSRIQAVRGFNRFYTRQIGVLQQGLLGSPFSLAEGRVLYELAHRDAPTATDLATDLDLDAGYLSRMLRGFTRRGLIARTPSAADGRRSHVTLTARGRQAADRLDRGSQQAVGTMLRRLPAADQRQLVAAAGTIESLLGPRAPQPAPYILRPPQPGDMGWVVGRHGALYAEEYGYDRRFEGLVASIVGAFVERFDPDRERCWIAEKDGENVGSVFLVRKSAQVAKLRLLIVEPSARGLGIGSRLVAECVRFARQAGYRTITLWTHGHLRAARHLYREAGFRLVRKQPAHSFGLDLVDEIWELKIGDRAIG